MIPTIIVDNFFKDPKKIVEFANSLEYSVAGNNYPGKRTECLSTIDSEFYRHFADKIFSYYPFNVNSYQLLLQFQKINEKYDVGLVHTDPCEITTIIYLNENSIENCGTGIYFPLQKVHSPIELDHQNFKKSDREKVLSHNKKYDKVIDINNVFNRGLFFDGRTPHCANSYTTEEDRFILIGFFKNVKIKPHENTSFLKNPL
jgi:hypothetical protein